jgi:hypothetical protein
MRLIPLEGRIDVPFGASLDDVICVLGRPDSDEIVHAVDSHPKGRRTLRYGNFSVTIGSELGVFGMSVRASSEPLLLWDTQINELSAKEFATFLLSHGARSETAPLTSYGATDVYSADYGILAYSASDRISEIELQIPYSCPTE